MTKEEMQLEIMKEQLNELKRGNQVKKPNKIVYVLLAWFVGGFGIHDFYRGKIGAGIVKLIFCWTLVPALIAFFQGFAALFNNRDFT